MYTCTFYPKQRKTHESKFVLDDCGAESSCCYNIYSSLTPHLPYVEYCKFEVESSLSA